MSNSFHPSPHASGRMSTLVSRAVGALYLATVTASTSFLFAVTTSRVMTLEARGQLVSLLVVAWTLGQIAALGTPAAALHFQPTGLSCGDILRNASRLIAVGVVACSIITLGLLRLVGVEEIQLLAIGVLLVLALPFANLFQGIAIAENAFWRIGTIRLIATAIPSGILAFRHWSAPTALSNATLAATLWVLATVAVIPAFWWIAARSQVSTATFTRTTTFAAYSLRSAPAAIFNYMTSRVDVWFVSYFTGLEYAALYSAALGLSELAAFVPQAIGTALHVTESRADVREDEARDDLRRLLALSLVLTGCLVLTAPTGLRLVFGDRFTPAAPSLRLLLVGSAILGLQRMIASRSAGRGRPEIMSWAALTSTLLLVALCAILVPAHGMLGAATASVIAYAAGAVATIILERRGTNA